MSYYIISTFLSIFVYSIGKNIKQFKTRMGRKCLVILTAMPLILIAAFRYGVGTDYYSYVNVFNTISYGKEYDIEILFVLLNKLISLFTKNYQWIFAVYAVLFVYPIYKYIFKESPYILLSIFLFVFGRFYFAYMNITRQLIGCSILLYSIKYIEERKIIPFLLVCLIASGIHLSCIVFIPAFWLYDLKISYKTMIVIIALAMIIGRTNIANVINSIIEKTKYNRYFGSRYDTDVMDRNMLLINIIVLSLPVIFNDKSKKMSFYINLQLIATTIISFSGSVPFALRLRFVYSLPSIILIPNAIKSIKDNKLRLLILIAVLMCFTYYGFLALKGNYYDILPYNVFWNIK